MVKCEIARQKAVDAWLDATSLRRRSPLRVKQQSLLKSIAFEKLPEIVKEQKFDETGQEHLVI